jgi:hypothetical protein
MPRSSKGNGAMYVIRMAASVVEWFTLDNRSDFGIGVKAELRRNDAVRGA